VIKLFSDLDQYRHSLPLALQNQILQDEVKKVVKELKNQQDLWRDELTMISNKLLGEKAVLMSQ